MRGDSAGSRAQTGVGLVYPLLLTLLFEDLHTLSLKGAGGKGPSVAPRPRIFLSGVYSFLIASLRSIRRLVNFGPKSPVHRPYVALHLSTVMNWGWRTSAVS